MYRVFERVAKWNSLRYDQVYDVNLTLELLSEEFGEWLDADEEVDRLDALCDLVYVALGAIWKEGSPPKEEDTKQALKVSHNLLCATELDPILHVGAVLMAYDRGSLTTLATLHTIIALAITQMQGMGLDFEDTIAAMLIVCDANDSKSIQKTEPNVKANVVKGDFFRSPEPRLKELLCQVKKSFH